MIAMAIACERNADLRTSRTLALDVTGSGRFSNHCSAEKQATHERAGHQKDLGMGGRGIAEHVVVMRRARCASRGPVDQIFGAPQDEVQKALDVPSRWTSARRCLH